MLTDVKPYRPGRPSKFTPELGKKVCQLLITGKSLNQISGRDGLPTKQTIINWLHDPGKKAFLAQYQRARNIQALMLDEGTIRTGALADGPQTLTLARLQAPSKNY